MHHIIDTQFILHIFNFLSGPGQSSRTFTTITIKKNSWFRMVTDEPVVYYFVSMHLRYVILPLVRIRSLPNTPATIWAATFRWTQLQTEHSCLIKKHCNATESRVLTLRSDFKKGIPPDNRGCRFIVQITPLLVDPHQSRTRRICSLR